jgi:hypothetical protein
VIVQDKKNWPSRHLMPAMQDGTGDGARDATQDGSQENKFPSKLVSSPEKCEPLSNV